MNRASILSTVAVLGLIGVAYFALALTDGTTVTAWVIYRCKGLDLSGAPIYGVPEKSSGAKDCQGISPSEQFLIGMGIVGVGVLLLEAREIERRTHV